MRHIPAGAASRAQRFRSRHHAGELLQGEVTSLLDFGRVWVQIDDMTLVASITREVKPGEMLAFRIESLEPDIVLKEIQSQPHSSTLIARFCTARRNFEQHIPPCTCSTWQQNFRQLLEQDEMLLSSLLQVRGMIRELNSRVDARQTLSYCPELLPGLNESLCIRTTEAGMSEILIYGEHQGRPIWITRRHTGTACSTVIHLPADLQDVSPALLAGQGPDVHVRSQARQPLRSVWERLEFHATKQLFHRTI